MEMDFVSAVDSLLPGEQLGARDQRRAVGDRRRRARVHVRPPELRQPPAGEDLVGVADLRLTALNLARTHADRCADGGGTQIGIRIGMLAIPLFILGAILGSFATAVAYRLPRGENWVSERSKCPACGAQIRVRDNVPIVSWLLLRGRCRDCGAPISARYPLAELTLGALFAATYLIIGDDEWWQLALGLVLCLVLVDHHAHRPRPAHHPEQGRSRRLGGRGRAGRDRRPRQPDRARGLRCDRRGADVRRSPSPTPAGWAWATRSSSR